VDETGAARMVDVSAKDVTTRTAIAAGCLLVSPAVVDLLRGDGVPKGDALGVARIAGIMGAKRTAELVPLCHPLALSAVTVDLTVLAHGVEIVAMVRTTDRTGVEMEALTAVAVAGLTLHDMVKAVDPAAELTAVRVVEKTGGRSGRWRRPTPDGGQAAAAGSRPAGPGPAGPAGPGPAAPGGPGTGGPGTDEPGTGGSVDGRPAAGGSAATSDPEAPR
jgi:cyclic pyranopterin phosphate synthase